MLYKKDINPHSKSKSENELYTELRKLVIVCYENFYYTEKLQKQAYNKGAKTENYAFSDKIWLNSKYIKSK